MSGSSEKSREIYETGLRNQHAVENQAVELLERQIGRLENYPEMTERMRRHVEESKEQVRRLETLLSGLGTSHSAVKDSVMAVAGNVAGMMHTPASDEVIKNAFANFAFEHYEIAAYKALLVLAEITGHNAAVAPLTQSLGEEEAMARWIDEHLAETTRMFVSRSEAGETAGR